MKTITYTAARANLATTMRNVCDDHAPIAISRANSNPVVLISMDDYEALRETAYLLRSPANAARLNASIEEAEAMMALKKKAKK